MRCLIVDDDPVCRKVLCAALRAYGTVEEAATGRDAAETVRLALEGHRPFRLIMLDIMMPDMDGQAALATIRAMELKHGLSQADGARIFMTTALGDGKNVMAAFREQCTGYLTKPIDLEKMFVQLKAHQLIPP